MNWLLRWQLVVMMITNGGGLEATMAIDGSDTKDENDKLPATVAIGDALHWWHINL